MSFIDSLAKASTKEAGIKQDAAISQQVSDDFFSQFLTGGAAAPPKPETTSTASPFDQMTSQNTNFMGFFNQFTDVVKRNANRATTVVSELSQSVAANVQSVATPQPAPAAPA